MKQPKFTDTARYPSGYTQSGATNIADTFKRIQKRILAELEQEKADAAEAQSKVRKIKGAK